MYSSSTLGRFGPAGLGQFGVAADCVGDDKTEVKVGFHHPLFHPIYYPYSPAKIPPSVWC